MVLVLLPVQREEKICNVEEQQERDGHGLYDDTFSKVWLSVLEGEMDSKPNAVQHSKQNDQVNERASHNVIVLSPRNLEISDNVRRKELLCTERHP